MAIASESRLGAFLKDRRTKLDPAALGFPLTRRRTAGLRREEVAQRASVSATWYTWLEQGRGEAPSADVLDRICPRVAGMLALEYSAFAVDGRLDLSMVIYNSATPKDVIKIRKLMKMRSRSRTA